MNSRANCSNRWLGTTYMGFLIRPPCLIFMQFLGEGGRVGQQDGQESRQGHPADAGVAKGRLSGPDRFLQDAGNAGVHFRQMRERSLPATCIAAGGS